MIDRLGYILVMVKVPLPVHPNPPASVQVPEIVFPFAVPLSVSVLPEGVPDLTIIPNVPFTLPLKLPLKVNDPVAVWPAVKHGDADVMVRFVTLSEPSSLTTSDVPSVARTSGSEARRSSAVISVRS